VNSLVNDFHSHTPILLLCEPDVLTIVGSHFYELFCSRCRSHIHSLECCSPPKLTPLFTSSGFTSQAHFIIHSSIHSIIAHSVAHSIMPPRLTL